jgi:serine protease
MRPRTLVALLSAAAVGAATAATMALLTTDPVRPLRVVVMEQAAGTASPRIRTVRVPDRTHARDLVDRLRRDPKTLAADINGRARAFDVDPRRKEQWALDRLDANKAWETGTGSGQIVAVVDTGVDASHPDLAGAVLPGHDFVDGDDNPADENGHGTHVAGIIAAQAGNGIGVAGLAPSAKVLPVRVLDADGEGDDADIAAGVVWATDHHASVINLSLGGPEANTVLKQAVAYAIRHGVVVVAAAGNSYFEGDPVMYPAAYPNVVAVAAVSFGDSRAIFSETGSYVSVAAPGLAVLSTYPGGRYTTMSGTSMAAPYVAATAALVRQSHPDMSGDQVAERLKSSAQDIGAPGRDDEFGAGMVDPLAARTDGKPRPAPAPTVPGLPGLPVPVLPAPTLPPVSVLPHPTLPVVPNLPNLPGPTGPGAPAPKRTVTADQVRIDADTRITGHVTPAGARVTVDLQRLDHNAWSTLDSTQTDGAGEYLFSRSRGSTPTLYRVRVAATAGYAESFSGPFTVRP